FERGVHQEQTLMSSRSVLVWSALAAVAVGAPAGAQLTDPIPQPIPPSPIHVVLRPVATGLVSPIDLVALGGGEHGRPGPDRRDGGHTVARQFVVDQTGLILLMKGGMIQPTPVLDITAVIAQLSPAFGTGAHGLNPGYDERGLLGLA